MNLPHTPGWRDTDRVSLQETAKQDHSRELIDLTGRRYGRWTVLSKSPSRMNGTHWNCRCDCGAECRVKAQALRERMSRSCGCSAGEHITISKQKQPGHAGKTVFLTDYKKSAVLKGVAWGLSDAEAFSLAVRNCHYCGTEPARKRYGKRKTEHSAFVHNGIDRVDPTLGYVVGNVVPCCTACNRAKSATPVAEWLAWVHRVSDHTRSRGGGQ